jgi:hypothetical protein
MTAEKKMLNYIEQLYNLYGDVCLKTSLRWVTSDSLHKEEEYTIIIGEIDSDPALKSLFRTLSFSTALYAATVALRKQRQLISALDVSTKDAREKLDTLRCLKKETEDDAVNEVESLEQPSIKAWEVKVSCYQAKRADAKKGLREAGHQYQFLRALDAATQQSGQERVLPVSRALEQTNNRLVQAALLQITEQESKALTRIKKVDDLCAGYLGHLDKAALRIEGGKKSRETRRERLESLEPKETIVKGIRGELVLSSGLGAVDTGLFASARLRSAKYWVNFSPEILVKQRDPFWSFLRGVAFLLAPVLVGVYSQKTKGTPFFWRSHGGVLVSKMKKPLSFGSSPASGG